MKKYIVICLLILTVLSSFSIAKDKTTSSTKNVDPIPISIVNLIATPEKYNEKLVKIKGFAIIEFEHTNLYLTEECAKHANYKNSILIYLGSDLKTYEKFSMKYVSVTGIFDSSDPKVMYEYSGALKEISEIKLWPKFYK